MPVVQAGFLGVAVPVLSVYLQFPLGIFPAFGLAAVARQFGVSVPLIASAVFTTLFWFAVSYALLRVVHAIHAREPRGT